MAAFQCVNRFAGAFLMSEYSSRLGERERVSKRMELHSANPIRGQARKPFGTIYGGCLGLSLRRKVLIVSG
jgi:hypothetical protein